MLVECITDLLGYIQYLRYFMTLISGAMCHIACSNHDNSQLETKRPHFNPAWNAAQSIASLRKYGWKS